MGEHYFLSSNDILPCSSHSLTSNASNLPYFIYGSVDRKKFQIQIPLPPKIDPSVSLMQIQEKPDVTYKDVGGAKAQIDQLREVVELPMLHVSKSAVIQHEAVHWSSSFLFLTMSSYFSC